LQTRILGILALATLGTPALGLDFGNGFTLSGDIELEYITAGGSSNSFTVGYLDATLGWRNQAGGARSSSASTLPP